MNYSSRLEEIMRSRKSHLKKYQDIVIGDYSIWKLIKFELIFTIVGPLPGIIGYFFRQMFYRFIFKKVGKGTVFGRNINLRHSYKITIGELCVIDDYCMLSAQGKNKSIITIGNEVFLGRGTVVDARGGDIKIDDYSNIGANCRIATTSKIKLGKYVLIASYSYVGGPQHRFNRLDIPIVQQGIEIKGGTVIEDDVWLGTDVKVLDGVSIGRGSIIGAGSVVIKDIPPYSIAYGVPAEVKGSRKNITSSQG